MNAGRVEVFIAANVDAFKRGIATAQEEMERFKKNSRAALEETEKAWGDAGAKLSAAGTTLTVGVTAPLVAAGGAAVKFAMDFESAFANVRKTVQNATEGEFAKLSDEIRRMSREIPVAAEELAVLAGSAAQLGIAKEDIAEFTRVTAEMSVATNLGAEEGATSLARIANITSMNAKEYRNLGSTIVALGNTHATTEREIVAFMLRLAGAGKTAGMNQAQIAGLAAKLSSLGIEAEMGGTAMSRMMIGMFKAAQEGGDALAGYVNIVRAVEPTITAADFGNLFKSDPSAAITMLVEGLGEIQRAGGDVIGVMADIGIDDMRLTDMTLRLANAQKGSLKQSLDIAATGWKENNALSKEAAQRFQTTENQLKTLWNQVKDAAREFGVALLPAIKDLISASVPFVQKLAEVGRWFASLPAPVRNTVMAIGALAAAIGPVLMLIGGMASGISALVGAWGLAGGVITGVAKGALTVAGGALKALIAALGGVGPALAIFAVGGVAYGIVSWFMTSTEWGQKLANVLGDVINRLRGIDTAKLAQGRDVKGEVEKNPVFAAFVASQRERAKTVGAGSTAAAGTSPAAGIKALSAQRDAAKAASAATREAAKATKEYYDALASVDLPTVFEWDEISASLERTIEHQERMKIATFDLSGLMETIPVDVPNQLGENFEHLGDRVVYVETKTMDWSKTLEIARDAMELLGVSADNVFGKIVNGFLAGKAAGQEAAKAWRSGNKTGAAAGGLSTLSSAYAGGSVLGGAAQGAAFGSAFGPWGAAIGGVVGGIAGLFGKGKKKREEEKKRKAEMDEIRRSIEDQFGSLKEAARMADLYGVNLKKAMDGKDPEALKKTLAELEKRMEGLKTMAEGAVTAMQGLAFEKDGEMFSVFSDPKVVEASARQFNATFWNVFQKQGFAAIEQLRPGYEALMAELERQGLNPSALGMDRMTQMFNLSADPKMKALMGVSSGQAQMLQGGLDAGVLDRQFVEDSTTIARATLEEMKKAGMDDATAASAMREQLVALQRSYEAQGQEMPEDLKSALAAAGIEVLPTQLDVLKDIRDGINRLAGSGRGDFGAASGFGIPSSPLPVSGRGFYAPATVPNMGGGLGPLIQTHAGEKVLVVPKGKKGGFFGAARGYGGEVDDDGVPRTGGGAGGGGGTTGGDGDDAGTGGSSPASVEAAVVRGLETALTNALEKVSRPVTIAPALTINEDPEGDKETRTQRRRATVAAVADAFKAREPQLMLEVRRALGL